MVIKLKMGHISSADFSKKHDAILEGEKAAMEALPQIMAIITQLRQEGRLEWGDKGGRWRVLGYHIK